MLELQFRRRVLGAVLADLRTDQGLSQGELGARTQPKLEQSGISRAENGLCSLEHWQIAHLLQALAHPGVRSLVTLFARLEHVTTRLHDEASRVLDFNMPAEENWWAPLSAEQLKLLLPIVFAKMKERPWKPTSLGI